MNNHNSLSNNWMSSRKWYLEILGAFILSKVRALLHILIAVGILCGIVFYAKGRTYLYLVATTVAVMIVWHIVRTLTPIYTLRKEESRITWSQIILLTSFGVWIVVFLKVLNINKDDPSYVIITVLGAVLGWIFQDTIKSVVAFFYLRANNLLKIGDWIEVPSQGINGKVKGISLTTVTLENWDTTTSAFPTYILHSGHFKNNQKMMEGKTHGRQMLKTFIIDTGWIHSVKEDELAKIQRILKTLPVHKRDFLEKE